MPKPKPLKPVILANAFKLFYSFVSVARGAFKQNYRLSSTAGSTRTPNNDVHGTAGCNFKQPSYLRRAALLLTIILTSATAYATLITPATASATTNSNLNFQARLENATGSIVADGTYNVEFKLYDASGGGTLLWTEDHYNNASNGIRVANGYLSTSLGSVTAFSGINWNQQLWLTMNIGGTSGGAVTLDGEMSPRLALTAVPYALQAAELGNGTNKATLDASGNLQLQQASTISTTTGALTLQSATTLTMQSAAGTTSSNVTLQSGNASAGASGNITIDNGTFTSGTPTINLGITNSRAINIGNATAGTVLTLESGTGTTALFNGATAHTIAIGTGAAVQGISIGSTNSTSSLALTAGTGGLAIQTQGGTLGIANNAVQQAVIMGNTTGSTSVTVFCGTGSCSFGSGAAAHTTTLGTTDTTSTTTIQGGNGGINLKTLDNGTGTAGTIQVGNTTGALIQTINIGTNATASSTSNVVIGSTIAGTVTLQPAGGVVLGKSASLSGSLIFDSSAAGSNTITLQAQAVNPASSATIFLPTAGATGTQCLASTSGSTSTSTTLQFGSCLAGNTLATVYANGTSQTDSTISLDSTRLGVIIKDNATPITGSLFTVQNSGGTTKFLDVTASNVVLNGATGTSETIASAGDTIKTSTNSLTAFQVQNSSSASLFRADTTNMRLGVDVTYALMGTVGTITPTQQVSGTLTLTNTYRYKITAIDSAGGESALSAEQSVLLTGSNRGIILNWTAITGASGYRIYRTAANGLTGTEKYLTAVLANTFTDTGAITLSGTNPPLSSTLAYASTNVSNSELQLSLGGNGTPTGQLYVAGTVPTVAQGTTSVFGSNNFSVATEGHFAYVADNGGSDLYALDISTPAAPVVLSGVSIPNPFDVVVQGRYAYITSNGGGPATFYIVDVSNPKSLVQVSSLSGLGSTFQVMTLYVSGRYAYVANKDASTLYIVDISNPASPFIAGSIGSLGSPTDVFVSGHYAYVTDISGNFRVVDVSNPTSPTTTSTTADANDPDSVYVSGRYAYVTESSGDRLQVYDISNPTSPSTTSLSPLTIDAIPWGATVSGHYAYAYSSSNGKIDIIDISNPYALRSVGSISESIHVTPHAISVQGRYMYVANDAAGGLDVFDLGGIYSQQLEAGSIETGGLTVDNNASIVGDAAIQGGLTVSASTQLGGTLGVGGSALFGNTSNSTAAFTIQNAAAASLFNVDTSTTSNLVTNGDFSADDGTTGWAAKGASTTLTRDTTQQWQGSAALQVFVNNTSANRGAQYSYTFGTTTQYTVSLYAKVSSGSISDFVLGYHDNADHNTCTSGTNSGTLTTSWTRFTCTFTTAGSVSSPTIYAIRTGTVAETFFIDGVQLQTGGTATAFDAGGALQVSGLINSPVAFGNKNDSTTAFQIQNAAGTNLFDVDSLNGRVGIGTNAPTADLTFGEATTRTINVLTRTTNTTGGNLTISAGTAGAGGSAFAGGVLTLQGGAAGGTGNANGGNVQVQGGAGVGTGVGGLVILTTPTYTTAASDANCYTSGAVVASSCSITSASVNGSSAIIVGFSASGQIATLPDPAITTAGRVIYVTGANGSSDFTLSVNGGGTGNTIAMRANTTATMIWNGVDWTAAGASSSTTLQAAYDNTLTSAGAAELVVSSTSNHNGLTIRDSSSAPVNGTLLEVQTQTASSIFSVNGTVTDYANNGGAENTFGSEWAGFGTGASISRNTNTTYVANGTGSAGITTSGSNAHTGGKNVLTTTLTANLQYSVSFAAKLTAGSASFTDLEVYYSKAGSAEDTVCTNYSTTTIPTSVWVKVNCTFTAPTSGETATNAIIVAQTTGVNRTWYIDNMSVTIAASQNYATDGGVDDNTNFTTNWTAVGTATISRNTTDGNDTSDSAQAAAGTTSGNGVRNKLSINPLTSTLYRISTYAKLSAGSAFTDFKVRYSRDGGTNFVDCVDYNGQTVVTTGWTQITCYVTTDSTAATSPYVYFVQPSAPGVSRTFLVDTFSMVLASSAVPNVQVGGGVLGGPTTLFTLDRAASAPIASNNDALLGSMYYDTTLGKLQCYESDGWGACGSSPDNIITLSPEYTNAVLHGSGVGTMTSDICSGSSGPLSINTSICAANETFNFYKWTSPQATPQTYSIYVTYQLPNTFKSFTSGSTSLMGRTDSTNSTVQYTIYKNHSGSALAACGSTVSVSTGVQSSWLTGVATGTADPSTCTFAANDSIVFKIDVIASSNANAYVGNLDFTYSNK